MRRLRERERQFFFWCNAVAGCYCRNISSLEIFSAGTLAEAVQCTTFKVAHCVHGMFTSFACSAGASAHTRHLSIYIKQYFFVPRLIELVWTAFRRLDTPILVERESARSKKLLLACFVILAGFLSWVTQFFSLHSELFTWSTCFVVAWTSHLDAFTWQKFASWATSKANLFAKCSSIAHYEVEKRESNLSVFI